MSAVAGQQADQPASVVRQSQPSPQSAQSSGLVRSHRQASVQMPPRAELCVLYTGRFVIQASLHPTGDMPIGHMFNVMGGDFFPITDARLHPLVPTRKLPADMARVMIVNKTFVDFYHARK